jgi:(heptosyl)LPS beta-1,4-glucosyltransferase
MTVQAIILTKNEERHVVECVQSLLWADHVVVFDSFSHDRTAELAISAGAKVMQHPFRDFARQRNAALEALACDWAFFVDADERATPEVAQEIRQAIQRDEINGWWIPRHNYVFGRLTKGAGYYPDYQMRLLRAGCGHYERPASEIVALQGADGYLTHPLIHYNYDSVAQFHAKQSARETFEATTLMRQGVRVRPYTMILQPVRHFWWRYVILQGYRDGWHGLRLCMLLAYYFGWRNYVRLLEMQKEDRGKLAN